MFNLPKSDRKLFSELTGDEPVRDRALEYLYAHYREKICKLVMTNNGSREDGIDLLQESIIALYENIQQGKFKGESSIQTYLLSIARFKWLNHLKKNKRAAEKHQNLVSDGIELPQEQILISLEQEQMIADLFGQLGEGCKSLLLATIYHNSSIKEVTQQLGLSSEQIARNKKYKCLKKLREVLQNRPDIVQIIKGL